ncbi:unnamed protein product [Adineta steineri]|uniref:Uncharacterized protein n=1 Tax=Adineta steineri TaxID=433720 RepID=A0A818GBC8_9BILA|nr:unnamed protein product [Adineta steineri]CAF3489006.1 unnamed protein product [Adineta steineri]
MNTRFVYGCNTETDNIRPGIVIATTNRQRLIDLPLYLRAQLEHEVLINTPDADERFNILGKCTTNMVLANDVDLGKIADETFGYARKLL